MPSADYLLLEEPTEMSRLQSSNDSNRGDAKSMCGDHVRCLLDRRKILDMHEESSYTASVYISIILSFYTVGMLFLLVHFVKQKYGQVSLYDIYLEVCPSRWTGIDTLPDARYPDEDEDLDLEEDPEVFTRKTTSSIRRFRLEFFSGSDKRGQQTGSEMSRKSSSASSVDASREGRDRRRRNKKKFRQFEKNSTDIAASSGLVAVNNSFSSSNCSDLGYFKTSPVVVTFPITEEVESSTSTPPPTSKISKTSNSSTISTFQLSFRSTGDQLESNVIQVEMKTLECVDKISFIDASSNCCTLKIDSISCTSEVVHHPNGMEEERRKVVTKETIL